MTDPKNLCANGRLTWEAEHTRVLDAFKVDCLLCHRTVRRLHDGRISQHVWAPKEELFGKAAKEINPQVYNSAQNRARRGFERDLERRARER